MAAALLLGTGGLPGPAAAQSLDAQAATPRHGAVREAPPSSGERSPPPPPPARTAAPQPSAVPLVAALSRTEIAITTGFHGDQIEVFGTTNRSIGAGADEVLVLVTGPSQSMAVRRKQRVLGFWVNGAAARYVDVPGFYALLGTRPARDILSEPDRRELQLGLDNIPLRGTGPQGVGYRAALRELKAEAREWLEDPAPVEVAAGHLFQARVPLPATVATGDYLVEVLLVRDRRVAARQALSLRVDRAGTAARIADVAEQLPLVYGVACVLLAAAAGWLGSVTFRRG